MAKKLETGAKQAALEIKALGTEVIKLTKQLEGLEKGTADYEKVNAKLQNKLKQIGSQVKQNTTDHKNSKNSIDAEIRALRTLQGTLDRSSVEYAQASQAIREHQQSLNQNSASTGLASTSAMEFGRVISDAPYGIRGMANNVSQLTSLLFQGAGQISATTGKVVGLSGAIKGMWASMMGPLGIMIAIQAVIAALDYFAGSTEKSTDATEELDNAFTKMQGGIRVSRDELEVLYEVMSDGTGTIEQQANALKDLKALGYDEATDSLDDFIEKQKDLIILEASSDLMRNQLKKLIEDRAAMSILNQNATDEYIKASDKVIEQQKVLDGLTNPQAKAGAAGALGLAKDVRDEAGKVLEDLAGDRDKMQGFIDEDAEKFKDLLKQIMNLRNVIGGGGNGSAEKVVKDYLGKLLDMESELNKHNDRLNDITVVNERELLRLSQDAQKRDLKLKLDNYTADETARYDAYVKKQQSVLDNDKSSAKAKEKANQAIIDAAVTHRENLDAAESGYDGVSSVLESTQLVERMQLDNELNAMTQEQNLKEREMKIEQDAWVTENGNTFQAYANDQRIALQQDIIDASVWKMENTQLSHEAELQELEKQRLAKKEIFELEKEDVVTIEEAKRAVFDASWGLLTKGLKSISQLMKKGSKEQKTVALLSIAAQTAEGIINGIVLAQKTAKASPPGAAPFIFASMAATQTTAVLGAAAQAKAILNGGNGSSSSSSGGDGGGSTTFTPNFNVVGNSGTNQLAEGINNQVNEPTRAYVVYEDIAEAGNVVEESVESSGI